MHTLLACRLGLAHKSCYLAHRGLHIYWQQLLIDNKVQAIILNESYLDMIAELSDLQTEQTGSTETEESEDFHDYAEFVKSLRKISGYSVASGKKSEYKAK